MFSGPGLRQFKNNKVDRVWPRKLGPCVQRALFDDAITVKNSFNFILGIGVIY